MKALTRKELYLQAIATGNTENLPTPQTREEAYLMEVAKGGGGGGGVTHSKVYYVAYNDETEQPELYKDVGLTIGVTIDDYETILGAEIIGVTDGTPNSYKGLCISASESSSGGFSVRYWDTASANVAYSSDYVAFNP